MLREYCPTFLDVFAGKSATNLAKPEARAVLAIAPTPAHIAKFTKARIMAALRGAGRQRGLDAVRHRNPRRVAEPQLRQSELIEKAMGCQTHALLATLDTACAGAADLERAAVKAFQPAS
ncbi:hypothetical protein [Nocardia sp. SC052]|uniref:hypothetical protein n=1 Tax=Nocardia sichangensis TaxID=3385975 RepID=UPI00399EF135